MTPPAGGARGVTPRAVLAGLGMVAVLDVWVIHAEYIVQASRMNVNHHFPISLLAAFVVLLTANGLSRRLRGRPFLTPSETLVVLGMGLVGIVIPSNGLTSFFLGILASPCYFASPENNWALLHDFVPSWIAPSGAGNAMIWFFEGLPPGAGIPWSAWIVPLFWWALLIGAVGLVSGCLASILRRQWTQNERLVYPLMSPALDMAGATEGEEAHGFGRGWRFWAGFSIPFGIILWNVGNYFSPAMPVIPVLGSWFNFVSWFPYAFNTRVNFSTIAFAYFANVDVLFSIWFFFLLFNLEMMIFHRIGFSISLGGGASNPAEANPAVSWQSFGAFLFWVIWGLYIARGHLLSVLKKTVGAPSDLDDSGEILSSRTAVLGLVGGFIFTLFWLRAAGMEIRVGLLFLTALFVIYLGLAKIVAEVGLLYAQAPLDAEEVAVCIVGARSMSPASLTAMAFAGALICYNKGALMPPMAHLARLGDFIRGHRRQLLLAAGLSVAVSFAVSVAYTLHIGYGNGAYNFSSYPFSYYSRQGFERAVSRIREPFGPDVDRIVFLCIGAASMALLTFLRYRLSWWPIHPIGFAMPRLTWQVFSIFLAWTCKTLILRIGGVALYRRSRPFSIGMLTGYALGVAMSFFVDWVWFPGNGHQIHSW